jgi:hypothetical protein
MFPKGSRKIPERFSKDFRRVPERFREVRRGSRKAPKRFKEYIGHLVEWGEVSRERARSIRCVIAMRCFSFLSIHSVVVPAVMRADCLFSFLSIHIYLYLYLYIYISWWNGGVKLSLTRQLQTGIYSAAPSFRRSTYSGVPHCQACGDWLPT